MLSDANLPKSLWKEAVTYANTITNCMPSEATGMTFYETLFGRKPDIINFHRFGCQAIALIQDKHLTKLEARAQPLIYVGPSYNSSGHRLWNPVTQKITINRNVTFYDDVIPTISNPNTSRYLDTYAEEDTDNEDILQVPLIAPPTVSPIVQGNIDIPLDISEVQIYANSSFVISDTNTTLLSNSGSIATDTVLSTQPIVNPASSSSSANPTAVISTANIVSSPITGNDQAPDIPPPNSTISSSRNPTDEESTKSTCIRTPSLKVRENIASGQRAFIVYVDPKTIREALNSSDGEKWMEAMRQEVQALEKNDTYNLVPRPLRITVVGVKWVYKLKYAVDGAISRYKARLVAKGYHQVKSVNYNETYAPTAQMNSLRVILQVAIQDGLALEQLDIDSAFLNGLINTEVYMEQPPLFEDKNHLDYVCKLKKGLYGLKQAGQIWHLTVKITIKEIGLNATSADSCVFTALWPEGRIIVYIHVDDFLMAGTIFAIIRFKTEFGSKFNTKELGPVKLLLEIQISVTGSSISLSQTNYLHKFLEEQSMLECSPRSLPISGGDVGVAFNSKHELCNKIVYQHLLGKVTYAMVSTRPDIAFAVGLLGRFMAAPTMHHLFMIKSLLRYLSHTKNFGIVYTKTEKLELKAYCDSDYAGDLRDRKSTRGEAIFLNDSPVGWRSRKQKCTATSSTEAEYMELSEVAKEVVWHRRFLADIGCPQIAPTPIYVNNTSAIAIALDDTESNRMKHIDVPFHYIREKIADETVRLIHCPTALQRADIFTKALEKEKFYPHRESFVHPL